MSYTRVLYFIGVLAVALFLPIWIFVPCAIFYAFAFRGYELLLIALIIDAQFGDTSGELWYRYTMVSAVILLVTTSVKPYLRFYS